jgi:hypothetical protein
MVPSNTLPSSSTVIDDYGSDPLSAGAVEVISGLETDDGAVVDVGIAAGTIEAMGDEDWFAVTLTEGESYQLEVLGATNGGGDLADPVLTVYDAGGNIVAGADDFETTVPDCSPVLDLDPLLEFVAPASGTYYLGASAFGEATGGYTVQAWGEPGSLPPPPPVAFGPAAGDDALALA